MSEEVDQSPAPPAKKTRVRFSHVVFVGLAFLATLCLAYWQWTRFRAGSGTFQNLGYAIQWPAFGIFIVYAYRRYIQLEQELEETGIAPMEAEKLQRAAEGEVTEVDAEFLPQRQELSVEEFNALNEPRRRRKSQ